MASDPASGVWGEIKSHPEAIALGVGGLVVLYLLFSMLGSSSSSTAAAAPTDDSATEAAAAIQATQVTANAQTALAAINAGVTNNQTSAAQTVALAQIQSTNDTTAAAAAATTATAYYGAATGIADANTAGAIAATQASVAEQGSQDTLIASEFSNLSSLLASFGNNTQSMVNTTTAAGVSLGGSAASIANTGSTSAATAASADASLTAANDAAAAAPTYVGAAPGGWLNEVFGNAGLAGSGLPSGSANVSSSVAGGLNTVGQIAAGTTAQGAASTTGFLNTASSWLSNLFGAFGGSVAATAPVTASPNMSTITAQNNSLLTGGPSLPTLSLASLSSVDAQ